MNQLPSRWRWLRLGELLAEPLINGRSVPTSDEGFPVLRLTALGDRHVDLTQHKIGAWTADEAGRFLVEAGDFLVARGNGSLRLVGQGGLVSHVESPVAFPDTMIRIRPAVEMIDPTYLALIWSSEGVRTQIERSAKTTAGIYKVNQKDLSSVLVPVPPLDEQRRIVNILEDQLSRVEAGVAGLTKVEKATESMRKAIIIGAIPDELPSSWEMRTVDDVGDARLGRQRHPDWHTGPNMHPYLRVANVFEDRIDTSDVMEMDFTDCFDQFQLAPGDVLLNEGQSPHLLGRPAIYRGVPARVAFTNSLIRFRPNADVTSEWALLVFQHHMHSRRFMRESRITTNIAHLSLTRLKSVEFPVPPLGEQMRIVDETNVQLDRAQHFRTTASVAITKALSLRRAMLTAAFTGKFTSKEAGF